MNVVIPKLANIILKQIGVAGAESRSLTVYIQSIWKSYADAYLEDFFKLIFNPDTGVFNPGGINALWLRYTLSLENDFIEKTLSGDFDFYLEKSFARGLGSIGIVRKQSAEEELLEEIARVAGASLNNTKRTIRRWFAETQGKYFDRFIKAETDRLFLAVQNTTDSTTLRSIGKRYKDFVQADGYWSGMGGFDANTAKVFGQVESLHQQNVKGYQIEAVFTEGTCPVCEHMDGSTWFVDEAIDEVEELTIIGAGNDPKVFNPWPDKNIVNNYPDPQDSPYRLPPFHLNCNCNVVPI